MLQGAKFPQFKYPFSMGLGESPQLLKYPDTQVLFEHAKVPGQLKSLHVRLPVL